MPIRVERSEIHPSAPSPRSGPGDRQIRIAGGLLFAGPVIWAAALLSIGETSNERLHDSDTIASIFFLVGLFAYSWVVLATRATGDRKGRAFPIVPMALFPFGVLTNLGSLGHTTYEDLPTWVMVTDPAWPLSQLGMLASAIAIIRVGRWQGALRWLPLGGALWLFVALAGQAALSGIGPALIFSGWMLATYCVLGILLMVRPGDARA
jgi:hypothetical protein